jgi:hypothetical protein
MRASVSRHLHAPDALDRDVHYHNIFEPFPRAVTRHRYRAIVLHNTFLCMRWSDVFAEYALRSEWIADRRCIKLAIPQDEYDHHEILDEWLHALGVTHVFSNFGPTERQTLYPMLHNRVPFTEVLTGYIDEQMAAYGRQDMRANEQRPLDIAYRSSDLPYWFGSQGQLKVNLGAAVAASATRSGFKVDISSKAEDTLYGNGWTDLLLSSRATIGCETGSSVLDHRGEIQAAIRVMLNHEPDLTFDAVSARMPAGWDSHRYFAIGPRHLEAVVTQTCQILVEGAYSKILEPGRHYVPVKSDLTDLDEALQVLQDGERVGRIARQAYEDIYLSGRYTYRALERELAAVVGEAPRRPPRRSRPVAAQRSGRYATRLRRAIRGPGALVSRHAQPRKGTWWQRKSS